MGAWKSESLGGMRIKLFRGASGARAPGDGGDLDAIMELPNGWDDAEFQVAGGISETAIRVDVGARTPEEVAKLGIKVGDTITIPKEYRPLIGTRANGRASTIASATRR